MRVRTAAVALLSRLLLLLLPTSMSSLPHQHLGNPPTTPMADVSASSNIQSPSRFSGALHRVLGDTAQYTPGGLSRSFGAKRKYCTTRSPKEPTPTRPPVVKSVDSIRDGTCFPPRKRDKPDEPRRCCSRECNSAFSPESIDRVRSKVPCVGIGQQRARKIYVQACVQDDKSLSLSDALGFSAVVCQAFFTAVTGCSKKLIYSAMELGGPGMKARCNVNTAAQVIMVFIMELASRWEYQPDSQTIHMAFPSKLYVYELYLASAACTALVGACSYSYFVIIWNQHCSHVKLKKTMRFTKCDTCTLATEALDKARQQGGAGWESEAMSVIKQSLEDHYRDVHLSRGVYMAAKLRALERPDELLCIAIDGSDQSSYAYPYFKQETKNTCKGWKMRMKLIGALVTGRLCHFFTIGSNWESGSNLTIQVLHDTLVELQRTSEQTGTPLPKRLHLQLDNCSRENKNRFFIGYLHLLVSLGVFNVIEMHFGPIGHTHDEIDQVFSRVAVALRKIDAATRRILGKYILGWYKANVSSFPVRLTHLYNCANIRDLLAGSMFPIPSVTKPQAFRVSRDPSDNKVKLQMQARSYEDKWSSIDRSGNYIPGYMEVMKPGPPPDLRETPDCPRKVVTEDTMVQHRNCFRAATDRIQIALRHGDDSTSFNEAMLELEADAVDLESSTPVKFDWDLSLYNLPPTPIEQPGGGGDGPGAGGDSPGGDGGGPGEGGDPPGGDGGGPGGDGGNGPGEGELQPDGGGGAGGDGDGVGLQWKVGWFVAFPLAASNPCSVVVGKIVAVVRAEEGDEVRVNWYTPKNRKMPRRRSLYGKGGWSQQFKLNRNGKRVPDTGRESVHAACATFPDLLASTHGLPGFVWDAVADNVEAPPEEEGQEEEEDEELDEVEEEGGGDEVDEEEEVDEQIKDPGVGGASGWQEPVQAPPSLKLPSRVRTPVRMTAAASRSRRHPPPA